MRLLILSQYFWPETFIINDLARLLADRQVEVTVLTGKPNYPGGKVLDGYKSHGVQREHVGDVEVIRLPLVPRGRGSSARLTINYLSFIASASLIGPFALRGRSFDAVFVYGTSPLLKALAAIVLAGLKKAPLIVWVQDLWPESLSATGHVRNRTVLAIVGALVRAIYRRADLILVQSRAFHDPVAVYSDHPDKIRYYPNLYESPAPGALVPAVESLVERLGQSFSVVFAGNIGTAQSPETILEAARLLKPDRDITIVLVGSGSRDRWLAEEAVRLGLDNLVFAGRFAPDEMSHIFAAASALLVTLAPEPPFALTVPSKIQAYLAAGRPIVAALDGEAARIIAEAGAGFCVPAGSAADLAETIRTLQRMPLEQREALGARGRDYFEGNFEPHKLTTDLIAHLSDAIASRESAA